MSTTHHEIKTLAISTLILGLLTGTGSVLLSLFLETVEKVAINFTETAAHPYAWQVGGVRRVLALFIGGVIVAIAWWYIRTHWQGPVSIGAALKGKRMPIPSMLVHVLSQILYVGVGGSVGREVAPRELAALVGQTWTRWLARHPHWRLDEADVRLLIAASAGAGFAGVYIAPITGSMFAIEMLMKDISKKTVMVSVTMASIATLVGSILKGFGPYYLVNHANFSLWGVGFVVVIGPLCGLVGAYFRRFFQWANAHQAHDRNVLWQLPLMALITGLIAVKFPQITGNGRALAQLAFTTKADTVVWVLIFGSLAKALVTTFTLRAGASGGTLTPSLALGACVGAIIGLVASWLIPGVPLWQMSLLGAAALLAASQQAPFMAMFMVFEVCHLNFSALLPLALGVALAMATSQLVLPKKTA